MWSRARLKNNAKDYLRKNYLNAFIVSLILMIVGGNSARNQSAIKFTTDQGHSEMSGLLTGLVIAGVFFGIVVGIIFILLSIFVGSPLEVGGRKYYIETMRGSESDFEYVTAPFKSPHYLNVVKVMFLRNVFIFLWFLALIIPGIIKLYAYSMVPYILAENPDMSYSEALMLSEDMTYTHKMNMFILDLSFIGWYILGGIFFGIGHIFVNPYVDATKAQLYEVLKEDARRDGFITA